MKACPFCAEQIQDLAIVCKHCGRDVATSTSTESFANSAGATKATPPSQHVGGARKGLGFAILGVLVVLGALAFNSQRGDPAPSNAQQYRQLPLPPRVITLSDSAFEVGAEGLVRWGLSIDASQPRCHLSGHVTVVSGGNKDVDVLVMSEDDYTNWRNGHEAKVRFQSGQKTAIPLDLDLTGPGRFAFVVSNTFSAFTAKTAEIKDVRLSCQS